MNKIHRKSNTIRTLQIITGTVAALGLSATVGLFYLGQISLNFKGIWILVFLLIFLTGFVLSWKNTKWTGILLMICNAGIWILDLFIGGYQNDSDTGTPSLVFSLVLFLGAFFLLEWYKSSTSTVPSA